LYHAGEVLYAAFRRDDAAILTGCGDRAARLWARAAPVPTGHAVPDAKLDVLPHIANSPDGRMFLMAHSDGSAQVRDADTNRAIGAPLELPYSVLSVAWSPDGTMLLSGSTDGTAHVWSARTRGRLGQALIHREAVHSVAFSPDSQAVVTGSADHSARVWDSRTGKPIGPPLNHDKPVRAVGFSTDGSSVLTRTDDGVVRRWERTPDAIGPDERFILWAQVSTGADLDENNFVRGLAPPGWKERRARLDALGGPPQH
jgi:WD40 repeat protein